MAARLISFALRTATLEGKEYSRAVIYVDEGKEEVQLWYEKRGLFSRKPVHLLTFTYGVETTAHVQGSALRVEEAGLGIDLLAFHDEDAKEIAELLAKPRQMALKQAEEDLRKAGEAVGQFLQQRAEALETLWRLRNAPRRTVMEHAAMIPDGCTDPIAEINKAVSKRVQEAYASIEKQLVDLEEKTRRLKPGAIEQLFLGMYGVGTAQDALFQRDEEKLKKALDVLKKAKVIQEGVQVKAEAVSLTGATRQILEMLQYQAGESRT